MEIRKRAELDVLYPEPQKGIKYDSPELLLMKYISEHNIDQATALFRDRRQFSDVPPAVDTPYGRFEGKEEIRAFSEGFTERFEAAGLNIVPKFQTRSGGRSVTEMVLNFEVDGMINQVPMFVVADLGSMGPLEVSKPWSPQGVAGARKWLNRVWKFITNEDNITAESDGKLDKVYHQTVKKVTSDFESLGFNTAISQMMIFVNACYDNGSCPKAYAEGLVQMLSCICPHIGEEMWSLLGHEETIAFAPWPKYCEDMLKEDTIQIPVQVNGKVRATVEISVNDEQPAVLKIAHAMQNVQNFIAGKTIVKEIYVKGRIVNIVVK